MLSGVETLIGSAFNDTLAGDLGNNALYGGALNDILSGAVGTDSLYGGTGADTLQGGKGADLVDGGAGIDTADYTTSAIAVKVTVNGAANTGGDAVGDVLTGIENLTGSKFNDVLTGDAFDNALSGGAGNDTIAGGAGADVINGAANTDTVDYSASSFGVNVTVNGAVNTGGDAAGDVLVNVENLAGSAFNDVLKGNTGNNQLSGGAGNDSLVGNAGNDILFGGSGGDTLIGGAGSDSLYGASGGNFLTGGSEADSFVFNTAPKNAAFDTVTDFVSGVDQLTFSSAAFAALSSAGDLAGHVLATDFLLGTVAAAAIDRLIYDQALGRLSYDADGVGGLAQVLVLTLNPGTALTANDLFLIA